MSVPLGTASCEYTTLVLENLCWSSTHWLEWVYKLISRSRFLSGYGGEIMKGPGCLGEFGSQGLLYWKGRERRGPHNETEGICLLHNFPRGQLCIWFLSYFLSFLSKEKVSGNNGLLSESTCMMKLSASGYLYWLFSGKCVMSWQCILAHIIFSLPNWVYFSVFWLFRGQCGGGDRTHNKVDGYMHFHSFKTKTKTFNYYSNVKLHCGIYILVIFMGFLISSHTRDWRKSVETTLNNHVEIVNLSLE